MVLVKSVEVSIGVKGDAESKAKLDAISARAEQLKKTFPEFTAKIDTAAAAEKLRLFRAQLADVTRDRTANVKVKVDDSALARLGQKMQAGGPGLLAGSAVLFAPAIATLGGVAAGVSAGLAGAFTAGAAAAATFGAVAKPILTDAAAASKAVTAAQQAHALAVEKVTGQYQIAMSTATTKAQKDAAYAAEQKGFQQAALNQQLAVNKATADLSPAQAALSRQISAMGAAWDKVKAAETPVVAGALLPWMQGITSAAGKLGPIIKQTADVVGYLGDKFRALVNSPTFTKFRDFIAGTGSAVLSATGSTFLDFIKAVMILLPKFDPLIRDAALHIAMLGPALVKWASSKKTADDIQSFMQWFYKNGPVVKDLLKNIGGTLKALAPGLAAGAVAELKILSDFFGFIAKLPPTLAKPLAEVAGALLILNKLGVVSVGLKMIGMNAAAAAGSGGAVGLWGKMLPGVRLVSGALVATIAVDMILKNTSSGKPGSGGNWFDNPFGGSNPSNPVKGSKPNALSSWNQLGADIANIWNSVWNNTITRTAKGFHDIAGWFDTGRHWVAARTDLTGHDIVNWWNITWNNTISRAARGFHDLAGWFDTGRHNIANTWDTVRRGTASAWDVIWNNTVGRTQRGVSDVMRWIGTLPGRVTGIFRGAIGWLSGAGRDVLQGFWNGLTSIWGQVTSWISGIAGWIKAHKGPVSLDKTLLYPAGHALMSGFLGGLKSGFGPVGSFVGGLASWISGQITNAGGKLVNGAINLVKGAFGVVSGSGTSFSVQQWIPTIIQALQMEGLPGNLLGDVLVQMQSESGGNPRAINLTDINAQLGDPSRGLMQTIGATFRYWHWPGTSWDIYDPLANIAAALNYAAHGKGFGSGAGQIGSGHGYAYGTSSAAPGWAWVGERGPELMLMRGGEQIRPMPGGRGGETHIHYHVAVSVPPTVNPREAGRQVADLLLKHTGTGGRLFPPGVTPR